MIELTMEEVRELFFPAEYARGMEYYHLDRVRDLREKTENGVCRVECVVMGTEDYDVVFQESVPGRIEAQCSCYWFGMTSSCKHLAAAMIHYVKNPPWAQKAQSDRFAQRLLKTYGEQGVYPELDGKTVDPARLIPRLETRYMNTNQYPTFSFKVGREKSYAINNIRGFLSNVHQRKTETLGKHLILNHSIEEFDEPSREMIRILMNEFQEYRSLKGNSGYGSGAYYASYNAKKNEITLTGNAFDRMFDLLEGRETELVAGGTVQFCREDPAVSVTVDPADQHALMQIKTEEPLRFFGSPHKLYALGQTRLHQCSDDFRRRVYPLLSLGQEKMLFALEDLTAFCGRVLPEIEGLVTVEDPAEVLAQYVPEECVPCFYFDMDEDVLTMNLRFRYGDREYPEKPETGETIRRDLRRENRTSAFAGQWLIRKDGFYYLDDEEAIFDFLTGGIDTFRDQGEVFVSERMNRKRIVPAKPKVGISVSNGMLTMDLDTGSFPPEELEALYQSLLRKKKYHRLADGRFMTLEGSGYEDLAEMSHMLQLSENDLAKGTVKLPAFRALYLDRVLGENEDLNVVRDRQFREMVNRFRSLEENDFPVPPHLEDVLRPYQKVGFRWLKTLESCGFGGILADEMGLGKTLQVITFLSTVDREKVGHPSLIVCPASLILNWGEEFAKFAPDLKVKRVMGSAAERRAMIDRSRDADVWVTSYELLRQDIRLYQELEFYACILDEGQHIKNKSTQVSTAVKAVNCRQRFVLTGTPVENKLSELWNLFDFLMPGYLFSHRVFVEKLEKPIVRSKNQDASDQLRKLVQPFLLRRVKKDVLKELPPKIEHIRRIALGETERRTYLSAVNEMKSALTGTGKFQILAMLTQLRQVCCDPHLCFENYGGETSKLEACLELCAGMTANGHQILLFSQFTSMLDIIRARLDELGISSYTIQGSTPKEKRAKLVKDFNNGGASVFLISLKAGGTGLNLTAADVVIHYDPWWNLAAQHQATDRAHRIGQQSCVQVYKLIAQDTIEERILDLQDRKAELFDIISGEPGNGILDLSGEELLALLEQT